MGLDGSFRLVIKPIAISDLSATVISGETEASDFMHRSSQAVIKSALWDSYIRLAIHFQSSDTTPGFHASSARETVATALLALKYKSAIMKHSASFAILFFLLGVAQAQFGFFEQMFGGQQQQQHHQAQNAPSDSGQYRQLYDRSHCDRYLCPDTLGTLDWLQSS